MITMYRFNRIKVTLCLALAVFFSLIITTDLFAQRNICTQCKTINASDSVECKECETSLNLCLDCKTANPANADYCVTCNAPLAEMRVLGSIDPTTRKRLKLGQSERAQIEKELQKISYLLEKYPEKAERLTYNRCKLLNKMEFHSREAESWREFLQQFPDSSRTQIAKKFLSEALRKWGFLFFQQKNKESALNLYKESVDQNPANYESWQWIGRIHMEAGETEKAIVAYISSLKADPGNKTSIHFLKRLKASIPAELLTKKAN